MFDINKVLSDLSKKLIKLTGNDLINKRIPGAGANQIFNVYDEIPEFIINNLLGTEEQSPKKLQIEPVKVDDEYLKDERTKRFKEKLNQLLKEDNILSEKDIEDDELRDFKNRVRTELGLKKVEDVIPNRDVILPRLSDSNTSRHTDKLLQTDVPDKNYEKILKGIEKKALSIEREKGIETLYLVFGLLSWEYEKDSYENAFYTSPAILIPINLEFKNGNYHISTENGEIILNPHLDSALQQVLGNGLPSFKPSRSKKSIGNYAGYYLDKLETFLKKTKLKEHKLERRMACGVFMSSGISPEELNPENYETESKTRMYDWLSGSEGMPKTLRNHDVDCEVYRELVPAVSVPADSSQHSAIVDAATGTSFYIQGPPGTGKSQTIVNIIANSLYRNKKILFLAQKTAALNVVYERLIDIGLESKCIPLHSEYTNKTALFSNLGLYLNESTSFRECENEFKLAVKQRDEIIDKLNAYTRFLSDSQGTDQNVNLTNHQIIVTHSVYGKSKHISCKFKFHKPISHNNIKKSKNLLEHIQSHSSGAEQEALSLLLTYFPNKIPTRFDIDEIQKDLEKHISILNEIQPDLRSWSEADFQNALNKYAKLKQLQTQRDKVLATVEGLCPQWQDVTVKQLNDSITELDNCSFLKSIFSSSVKLEIKKNQILFENNSLKIPQILIQINELKRLLVEYRTLIDDISKISDEGHSTDDVARIIDLLSVNLEQYKSANEYFQQQGFQIRAENLSNLVHCLKITLRTLPSLESFGKISLLKKELAELCDVNEFIDEILIEGKDLVDEFLIRLFYEGAKELSSLWINKAGSIPTGKDINKLRSELKIAEKNVSKQYNKYIHHLNPDLSNVVQGNAPRVGDKRGLALLKHLASKPKARVTLREMIHKSGDVLNTVAPCFLSTPSSVSELIPRGMNFDLCIIDEASQMLVEEAAGSMLRSKQIIVVGDQKQMTPTNYMTSSVGDNDDNQITEKNESILDRCVSTLGKLRRLQYHYRSQDDSLIQFSNINFYDGDLMIPPTCRKKPDFGVSQIKLDNATYNPGNITKSKNPNPIEAEKIVEIIENQITQNPNDSIGVAVLNLKQTIRITEIWEERLSKSKTLQKYVNNFSKTNAYFFIKNLENVQGDERDTIIVGTVFGKTNEDVVPQNFGPINQDIGPNRINVLITRAKKRLIVCTSLAPNDITSKAKGMQVLKDYLSYSKTGDMPVASLPENEKYDSPWEKWFKERLEEDGFQVDPQVGVSKFRIDLGVKHSKFPDGYLCGVELDGAAYHLEPSARERDHCRQSILESKGWSILRVWSTDFFSDQEGTYQILKDQIQNLLNGKKN